MFRLFGFSLLIRVPAVPRSANVSVAPEIDGASAVSAVVLLSGGLLVLRARRTKVTQSFPFVILIGGEIMSRFFGLALLMAAAAVRVRQAVLLRPRLTAPRRHLQSSCFPADCWSCGLAARSKSFLLLPRRLKRRGEHEC